MRYITNTWYQHLPHDLQDYNTLTNGNPLQTYSADYASIDFYFKLLNGGNTLTIDDSALE